VGPPAAPDTDNDGVNDAQDCAPNDPDVHVGAPDPFGDGRDTDCDGFDGVDRDGDGYPSNVDALDPLRDCDDTDPAIHPGAEDEPGNGVDEDCDGNDVQDTDGDGTFDHEDCEPENPAVHDEDEDEDGA